MTDVAGVVPAGGTGTTPVSIPEEMAADLVAAWAQLSNVHRSKTANAGTYSYSYADLGDLLASARPILAAHGLALIQPLERADSPVVTICTTFVHRTGATMVWRFDIQAGGTPQQVGSAITYGRRYAAAAALGVAYAGDDDDGAAATKAVPPARRVRPASTAREAMTRRAMALFSDAGLGEREARLTETSRILGRAVESWNDLPDREMGRVIDQLELDLEVVDDET